MPSQNDRKKELAWAMNDLVVDLKTPTDILALLGPSLLKKGELLSVRRLCLSALIVNLCKFDELSSHYGKEINELTPKLKDMVRHIKLTIEGKKMYAYRSTYLAHALSMVKGQPKRPLSLKEATTSLMIIIDEGLNPIAKNIDAFCEWIYKKGEENSVVNVAHAIVKEIDKELNGIGKRI